MAQGGVAGEPGGIQPAVTCYSRDRDEKTDLLSPSDVQEEAEGEDGRSDVQRPKGPCLLLCSAPTCVVFQLYIGQKGRAYFLPPPPSEPPPWAPRSQGCAEGGKACVSPPANVALAGTGGPLEIYSWARGVIP